MKSIFSNLTKPWSVPGFRFGFPVYLILLLATNAEAATRYVGNCGSPSNLTIAAAITAAAAGDEILVCPGTYNEAVTVNKDNLTIRGSTGVRSAVTISNAGIPFTLSAMNPTLKDMTITSSNNRGVSRTWASSASPATFSNLAVSAKEYGIYVDTATKVTSSNLSVTSSNSNAIHLGWGANGAHEFDTITATASNGRAIYVSQGGAIFRNLTLSSKNEALYFSPTYNAVFENITATSSNSAGFYLAWVEPASTLAFSNVTITAKLHGIYISRSGKATFSNVSVSSSNSDAIYLDWGANGAHEFDTITATASNGRAIYADQGGAIFRNLTLSSKNEALYFSPTYNAVFENITATSSNNAGFYLAWASPASTLAFSNVTITAKLHGIYISRSGKATFSNVSVSSSDSDAIYLGYSASGAHVLSNMTLNAKESGIKINSSVPSTTMNNICVDSGKYGIWVSQWGGRNVSIQNSKLTATIYGIWTDADRSYPTIASNNAFMKASAPRAYSSASGHKFDGNYWQGVAGGTVYTDGNIRDGATLASNPVASCYSSGGGAGPHHYELSLPAASVTCLPATVTVTACADSSNPCTSVATSVTGTASLASTGGTIGTATLAAGIGTATLSHPLATDGTAVTVSLTSATTPATNPATCRGGTGCATTFNTAGFIFSGAADGAAATIPSQVAGTSSGTYYLRAVKMNTTTKACESALSGANTVNFAYECNNPTTCYTTNLMSVNGGTATTIARNNNGSVSSYTPVNMTFDANGNAPFTFNYSDVGQVKLYASKAAGGSLLSALTGSSNAFVVKPGGFVLSGIMRTSDSFANPAAVDAAGAKFVKAGEAFSATVTAVTSTGSPAFNYGKEASPESVKLTSALAAGLGLTNNPAVGGTFGAFSNGVASGTAFIWNEVGIIKLTPSVSDADYLGAGDVSGTQSGNVGRFIPDNFNVTVITSPVLGTTCGTFTYVGQTFGYTTAPVMTVTARNSSNATTTNYAGAFMKLTNASLTPGTQGARYSRFDALGGGTTPALDTAVLPATTSDPAIGTFTNGVGTLTFSSGSGLGFVRSTTTPSAPFNADIALELNVIDTDGVAFTGNPAAFGAATAGGGIGFSGGKGVRFGHLRLANAYGSELLDLPIAFQTQFWNGSAFVTNTDDNCTTLASSSIALSNYQHNLASGETGVSPATLSFASGVGSIKLTRPGAGNSGSADLCVDLGPDPGGGTVCSATSANLPFLQGKWRPGTNWDNDPSGRATFGIYKSPLIYRRENY